MYIYDLTHTPSTLSLSLSLFTQVPLWLALTLKKQKKCRIVLPDWILDGKPYY